VAKKRGPGRPPTGRSLTLGGRRVEVNLSPDQAERLTSEYGSPGKGIIALVEREFPIDSGKSPTRKPHEA
jgi:hypothetical protein